MIKFYSETEVNFLKRLLKEAVSALNSTGECCGCNDCEICKHCLEDDCDNFSFEWECTDEVKNLIGGTE